jgi:septal ring factor EnvC (AmiA/AmiB activator)
VNKRLFRSTVLGILLCCGSLVMPVCVLFAGQYEPGKTRSLDLQLLLEQEKERTAELDGEIQRTKEEMRTLSLELGELSAQVQNARDQMARLQQEVEAINESSLLQRKTTQDVGSGAMDVPRGGRHRSNK